MGVLGIILALALLTYIAFKGHSVIIFAPICALLATLIAGVPLLPTYTEVFMPKAMAFATSYFPLFLLGALFGKVMEETGAAKSIAHFVMTKLGPKGTILAVVLSCAILAYGGVSVFVVVFAVYPLGAALFREANIPKRLLPAAIALGSFTFVMTAFPGTPQIQNLIPVKYFGTDAYAASFLGIIAGLCMFAFGMFWLEFRKRKAMEAGEGYGENHINEPEGDFGSENLMNPYLAIIPLIAVLVLNFILTKAIQSWNPEIAEAYGTQLSKVAPIWALIIAILVGIILSLALGWKKVGGEANLKKAFSGGVNGSLTAIMNTSAAVGFGSVIQSLPGFKAVSDFMLSINLGTPLISEAITVNILAGITGSASGGMSIALEAMAPQYLEWASTVGTSPELLHRVASLSCGGLDSLPHNGAIITLLAITGLTHKSAYKDIGVVSVLIPIASTLLIILLGTIFGTF